jgi:hypothetical protein
MKKIMLSLMILATVSAEAKLETGWDRIKDKATRYGIPCAASYVLGMALSSSEGLAIGTVGCAASSAVTYLTTNRIEELEKENKKKSQELVVFKEDMKKAVLGKDKSVFIKELKKEVYQGVSTELLSDTAFIEKVLAKLGEDFNGYKELIRKVLVVKLSDMSEALKGEIQEELLTGEGVKALEERLKVSTKKEVKEVFKKNRKEFVEEAVEKTLDAVVVKTIGVQK